MKAFALTAVAALMVGQAEAKTGTITFDGTTGVTDIYGYTTDAGGSRHDFSETVSLFSGLDFSLVFHYDTKYTTHLPAKPGNVSESYHTRINGFEFFISNALVYSTFTSGLDFTQQGGSVLQDLVYSTPTSTGFDSAHIWASHTDDYFLPNDQISKEY